MPGFTRFLAKFDLNSGRASTNLVLEEVVAFGEEKTVLRVIAFRGAWAGWGRGSWGSWQRATVGISQLAGGWQVGLG